MRSAQQTGDKLTPKIGLVLGSGSAKGWAHIGVIKALRAAGLAPDFIVGTSIGAFVGAAAASDSFDELHDWALSLRRRDTLSWLDPTFKGGLIHGNKLMRFVEAQLFDKTFAEMSMPFACVATDFTDGKEVWLSEGSVVDAVRASIAMPGIFTPQELGGRLLIDGGLVNPVPVSLARAMGADITIAVDLSFDRLARTAVLMPGSELAEEVEHATWYDRVLNKVRGSDQDNKETLPWPSIWSVVHGSIDIMSNRIARSRLAGEPADLLITPRVAKIGSMDFHRAAEGIKEGELAVQHSLPFMHTELRALFYRKTQQ